MPSDNKKNDIPADSPIMRSAMLNVTADGKNSFRTSIFGFNKEAVMSYIDRLYTEYASEERRLNESLERLQRANSVLRERSDSMDAQIAEMQDKVLSEISYVNDFHEIEDSYKQKIEGLSKEVDVLAEKYNNEVSEKNELYAKLEAALSGSKDARDDFNRSYTELQNSVSEKEKEINRLLNAAEKNQQEIEQLKKENLDLVQGETSKFEERIQSLTEEKKEQKDQIDDLASQVAALESEMILERTRYEQRVEKNSELIDSLKAQIAEQNKQLSGADYYSKEKIGNITSAYDNTKMLVDICRCYVKDFENKKRNLFITGISGIGKTYIASCVALEVANRGFSVAYGTAFDILGAMEDKKFNRESSEDKTDDYKKADLLIIDDLGAEMITAYSTAALYNLISMRQTAAKATILISTFSVSEIKNKYTPQIASRIEGDYTELSLVGQDIRKKLGE